jgi:hypothetical protein
VQAGKLTQVIVEKVIATNGLDAPGSLALALEKLAARLDSAQAGKLAQAIAEKVIATDDPHAHAYLARAYAALRGERDPVQAGKLAQAIVDKVIAMNDPHARESLARAIEKPSQDADQDSKRRIKEVIERWISKVRDITQSLPLLEAFKQLNPTQTELSSFLFECLNSSSLPEPDHSKLNRNQAESALESLAGLKDEKGQPGWLDDILIDFLKRPDCVGEWETTTIELLGASAGTDFHDDLWEVVAYPGFVEAVKRPMRRPRWMSW